MRLRGVRALTVSLAVALTVALAVALTACASPTPPEPTRHLGPICAIAPLANTVWSASVAGVFDGDGRRLPDVSMRVFALDARDHDGDELLLIGGGTPGERGAVALFSASDRRRIGAGEIATDVVYGVALHPERARALAACADGRVLELSLPELEVVGERARHTSAARDVAWSEDGTLWASVGLDGIVNLGGDDLATPLALRDHTAGIDCVLFAGDRIASGARDGRLRVHRSDGVLALSSDRLGAAVLGVALASDGHVIACGLGDGRLVEFDLVTRQLEPIADLPAPAHSLGALVNGTWVAGTADHVVRVPRARTPASSVAR